MFLDPIIKQYQDNHLYPGIVPATEDEVQQYEMALGLPLPIAYREFLLWMGRDTGELFLGGIVTLPDALNLLGWAIQILQEQEPVLNLPPDAIVFWMYDDYDQFRFIRLSDGNNPPVYNYANSNHQAGFVQVYQHFSDLIAEELAEPFRRMQICRSFFEGDRYSLFPTIYLKPAREFWASSGLDRKLKQEAYTPDEIFAIEEKLGYVLPSAYRELMLWLGDGVSLGLGSREKFDLTRLRLQAIKVMRDLDFPDPLPIDAFVFAPYYTTSFRYLRLSEGDNPPVYALRGHNGESEKLADTFGDYILALSKEQAERAEAR